MKNKKIIIYCSVLLVSVLLIAVTGIIVSCQNLPNGMGGLEEASGLSSYNFSQDDTELSYVTYRVQQGDMIGVIAEQHGITEDTIISVNGVKSSRYLQIGTYLKIPSIPGILYTVSDGSETAASIASKYKVDVNKCVAVNKVAADEPLEEGRSIFVPDAKLDWVTRQEINGDLFRKPLHSRYYISSWYGWRTSPFDASKRTYHGGIDMACSKGTPIYAALEGTVIATGYSDVFGNYVKVKHHSGYVTLYGHMSEITTTKGKYVTTSSVIGKVGSTGMSTGPHLHFQVYKNGRTVNPASLWK